MIKDKIERQLKFISSIIYDGEKSQVLNPHVSLWSVAQHLDHLLKAAELILTQIIQKEKRATKKMNIFGTVVLFLGAMPKGRKSPKRVEGQPKSVDELKAQLHRVESLLGNIDFENLEAASFDHHVFGGLDGKQWLRFMIIHNAHHEKIIKRILA